MKKILILLLSVVPLLFTSCFGLWGPHEEDIRTRFYGNLYADGKLMENPKVYYEGSKIEVTKDSLVKLPYVYVEWKTLEKQTMKTYPFDSSDVSFETECFFTKNYASVYGQELMDISVFKFTYYPEEGEPVEVSFEGKELKSYKGYNIDFYATIDFDTKTVYPNELK